MDVVLTITVTVQLHEKYQYVARGNATLDVTIPLEVLKYVDCAGLANNLRGVAEFRFREALKEEEEGGDDEQSA